MSLALVPTANRRRLGITLFDLLHVSCMKQVKYSRDYLWVSASSHFKVPNRPHSFEICDVKLWKPKWGGGYAGRYYLLCGEEKST